MNPSLLLRHAAPAVLLLLVACSSPDSRIAKNRGLFDSLPPAAQADIRAGRVALGFTPDMVRLALGEPDREVTRTDASGERLIWIYYDNSPAFSLGVGAGSGGYARTSGGVILSPSSDNTERLRVEFAQGKVVAVAQPAPTKRKS